MKQSLERVGERVSGETGYSRHVKFKNVDNFRDLGGYPAADGRLVRWGVLYRSASLHKLTDMDLNRLEKLNIQRVIDFRAEYEVAHAPDRLPEGVGLLHLPMEDSSTKVWHEARDEMVRNMKTLDPAEYMIATNTELATKFTPGYHRFYQEILASDGEPILFHCAAGKDRTGFAAATLLRILGVPREVVMQDYLLTNTYLLDRYKWNLVVAGLLRGRKFADGIRGFIRADERYLSAAFHVLEREHGSFENYVRDGLGLSDADIERLKNIYLVSSHS